MDNTVPSVFGSLIQTHQYLDLPVVLPEHCTINENLDIVPTLVYADTEMPATRYVVIGNKGHKLTVGTDNIPLSDVVSHQPDDAGLFNMIPFVLREPSNDLTSVERLKYRLRRTEIHNGVGYVAYYARVLDTSTTEPSIQYRTIVDGEVRSSDFVPTVAKLNPTPVSATAGSTVTTSGDYIAVTAKVPFAMSASEVQELLNVSSIIYGDERYAIISEIATVAGVDRAVPGVFNGATLSYTELIGGVITSFVGCYYPAVFYTDGINVVLDIGAVESLLKVS